MAKTRKMKTRRSKRGGMMKSLGKKATNMYRGYTQSQELSAKERIKVFGKEFVNEDIIALEYELKQKEAADKMLKRQMIANKRELAKIQHDIQKAKSDAVELIEHEKNLKESGLDDFDLHLSSSGSSGSSSGDPWEIKPKSKSKTKKRKSSH